MHALERLKQKGISRDDVPHVIEDYSTHETDRFSHRITQMVDNGKLLRVFYVEREGNIVVITAYRTSKVRKYKPE